MDGRDGKTEQRLIEAAEWHEARIEECKARREWAVEPHAADLSAYIEQYALAAQALRLQAKGECRHSWHPIATVPRDGKPVTVWVPGKGPTSAQYNAHSEPQASHWTILEGPTTTASSPEGGEAESTLLPCPFCGCGAYWPSEEEKDERRYVEARVMCTNCGAEVSGVAAAPKGAGQ